MRHLQLKASDFSVALHGPKGVEKLEITDDQPPYHSLLKFWLYQLGAMHLVAPYLYDRIRTNFEIVPRVKTLISKMYQSEGKQAPIFEQTQNSISLSNFGTVSKSDSHKVAILYSGGLDSMWNRIWAEQKYGAENVLLIHIRGLNKSNTSQEYYSTLQQVETTDCKNFRVIDLKNSSRNCKHKVMVSRDMMIPAIALPYALEFGASKIVMEGFAEAGKNEPFTGQEKNMIYFNDHVLRPLGMPISVSWRNRLEMDVVKDLYAYQPSWMKLVSNCFMAMPWRIGHQKLWMKRTPNFPLSNTQCGVCPKCKRVKIAEIRYNPQIKTVPSEEIKKYLKITVSWINDKDSWRYRDTITPSFLRDLKWACRKYKVPFRQLY